MPTGSRAIQPPGWLRVAFEGTNQGTSWAVINWFVTTPTTDPTQAELDTLIDLIAEAFGDNLIVNGNVSTDVQLTTIRGVYATASPPDKMRSVRVADEVGGSGGAAEAGQVCYLIDWNSADGRRGGKPRSYIPGVTNASMADQAVLNASDQANMTTHANAYHNAVNAITSSPWSTIHLVDASFVNGGAYRLTPHAYEIFGGFCSNAVGTQRRRVNRRRIS